MEKRVLVFLNAKSVLWNEGKAVALAWFNNDTLVINKGTNEKIRNMIKTLNNSKFNINE